MLKARLTRAQPRALLLAVGILAVTAANATAATIHSPSTGNWSVIGTTGNDTIDQTTSTATANDIIIGLGGSDSITVGNGANVIEADGKCPAGDQDTVTPAPGDSVYCSLYQITTSHTDTITAGNGADLILGGGYKNTITSGNGANAIYAGGTNSNSVTVGNGANLIVCGSGTNTITAGNGTNVIDCNSPSGPNTISVGSGTSTIFAQNGKTDTITCAKGNNATVYADKSDKVSGCKTVTTKQVSVAVPAPSMSPPSKASIRRMAAAKVHVVKKHSRKPKKHSRGRH